MIMIYNEILLLGYTSLWMKLNVLSENIDECYGEADVL